MPSIAGASNSKSNIFSYQSAIASSKINESNNTTTKQNQNEYYRTR